MNATTLEADAPALDKEEIATLRESIADVLASESDTRAVHLWLDRENDLEATIWRQAAELGWLTLALPEADGGLGLGARGLQILCRELGKQATPGPFIPTLSFAQWLTHAGSAELRAELLPAIVAGELTVALPAVLDRATPLTLSGDTVSGKVDVLGSVDAKLALISVGTEGWALVRTDTGAASIEAVEIWDRTRQLCRVSFNDAPTRAIIADPDGALGQLLGSYVAIAIAADSVGGADSIAHKTIDYLKERVQFERPIASFQAIKHRAADLIWKITTQDALVEQAVQSLERGSPDAAMWARLAKAGATETFVAVTTDCIQLFGGVGHTWEYDPHIYAKRARLNQGLLNDAGSLRDGAVQLLNQALAQGRTTTEIDT